MFAFSASGLVWATTFTCLLSVRQLAWKVVLFVEQFITRKSQGRVGGETTCCALGNCIAITLFDMLCADKRHAAQTYWQMELVDFLVSSSVFGTL